MRRLRDLIYTHEADLGGAEYLSEGQKALIRRVSMLEAQLEQMEAKFAANDGIAGAKDLDLYGRTSGNLRRLLESLGLHKGRVPRDITTLGDVLRSGASGGGEVLSP
jgi:hypothetical protein